MRSKILLYLFTYGIFVSSQVSAQFSETIFYDTVTRVSNDGFVHSSFADGKYIYLSGSSFSQYAPLPTVTKMDTSGVVIWTASDEDNYGRFGNYLGYENSIASCNGTFKSGNRVFTIAEPAAYFLASTKLHEVWCISDSSGVLLWKVNINKSWIVRIADYSDTTLLAVTRTSSEQNSFIGIYDYHVIHKSTGAVIFTKHFGDAGVSLFNTPNILVDNSKNILLSWDDTCKKFRDDRLSQLLWTSHIPYDGSLKMIDVVVQDSNRYYFSGKNNVRCVDTLTGATVWYKQYPSIGFIAGVQSGGDCRPKDILFKDSVLYVTWSSIYVGSVGLDRAFTLMRLNKYNGTVRYLVAHDFTGVPPDPPPAFTSELDWPFKICMDDNRNIYMVGSYDRGPGAEDPGNWGIMRINSETGQKIYEATITYDPTQRSTKSQAKFVYYFDGKLFATGNLQKLSDPNYASPLIMSFDTAAVFNERYRKPVTSTIRYSSSLKNLLPFSVAKITLLKKIGRRSVIELRNNNNQPLWSKSFASANKFMIPQNIVTLSDTGIAASFILYLQDTSTKTMPVQADSLVFVRLDTIGNIKFTHSIKCNVADTISAVQVYKDDRGKVNFIYRKKNGPVYNYHGYTLGGTVNTLSQLASNVLFDPDTSVLRIAPLEQFNVDTTVMYQTGNLFSSRGWLQSNTQTSSYAFLGTRIIRNYARIYSTLRLDSIAFYVMGRDSTGQLRGALYNPRLTNPLIWSYLPAVNGTMYNADSSAQFLYTVSAGTPVKKLILNKLDRTNGTPIWNFERNPLARNAILPTDLKYDRINRRFTVGGFIADSSVSGIRSSYFYITLDSTGTLIKDIVRPGFGIGETKINAVSNTQNGTNMYGGSISLPSFGTVGFYNADCTGSNLVPTVNISASSTAICNGTAVTFTANAVNEGSGPVYQWQVNGSIVGTNSAYFTTNTLTNNAQVQVLLTSNASCLQTNNANSNIITVSVGSASTTGATISGVTTVNQGQSSNVIVTPVNGGSSPVYQWQDSTNTHTWQNIAGAINSNLNYTPVATGHKLRCLMTSSLGCASPITATSNSLTFTVNTVTSINPVPAGEFGIIYYPNPANTVLVIDSLRLNDKWEILSVISIYGQKVIHGVDIQNKKTITLNVTQLPAGLYVAILNGRNNKRAYLKFQRL